LKDARIRGFAGPRNQVEAPLALSPRADGSTFEVIDQTVAGLNFITTRDRLTIVGELSSLVQRIYAPRAYFDRVLEVGKRLRMQSRYRPRRFARKRMAKGFFRASRILLKDPRTRWLYLRNLLRLLPRGPHVIEQVMRLMGAYMHFDKQARYLVKALEAGRPVHAALPAKVEPKARESA
jgi:hypothetical protein